MLLDRPIELSSNTGNTAELVYALVGNPNSGKTTIFNHLTGLCQKVANYPGVTVEKKIGICFSQHGQKMKIIDLPGAYSLSPHSPDEEILQKVLFGGISGTPLPNRFICVVDASNIERNLFLAAQIAELGRPTILVLNMMDVAKEDGLFIDTGRIEKELGVTVVPMEAHKKEGLMALKLAMSRKSLPQPKISLDLPQEISEAILNIQASLINLKGHNLNTARGEALLLIESSQLVPSDPAIVELVKSWQKQLTQDLPNWRSKIIKARYERIHKLCHEAVLQRNLNQKSFTEMLDSIVLHKYLGWIILVLVMGSLFWSIFTISEYPMSAIDWIFEQIGYFLHNLLPEGPVRNLLVNGVVSGVGSVLVFLPQILLLFFFIGILESTGYLPRAAFLLDKIMSKVGLHGKSFIPLLSSYACAVPGIMATRTLPSKQERLATIMIAPWMSCSARLPIYLLMIATLVPNAEASPLVKALMLMGIYATATLMALGMAWVLRKTLLKGTSGSSHMELPSYRMPAWKNISIEMLRRGMIFVKRAGALILLFSVLLWFLISYPKSESSDPSVRIENSFLGSVGHMMEPVLEPLGFDWKIGIGVLSSFAARELFISTMAIIYNVEEISHTRSSLSTTFQEQRKADDSILFTPLTCISLLVFFMFAMQCFSTLVIVRRETNSWKWPLFQLFYMTSFAYIAALIVYQGGKLLGFS